MLNAQLLVSEKVKFEFVLLLKYWANNLSILSFNFSIYKVKMIIKLKVKVLVTQFCVTLQTHVLQPARLLCPWDSPGKSTGVGYHFLLQGIFPTQGPNPGLPASQEDSLLSEPQGKPNNKAILLLFTHPTPALSPGESHGWRSLVGCSPWCH